MAKLRRYCGPYILTIENGYIKEYCGKTLYEITGNKIRRYCGNYLYEINGNYIRDYCGPTILEFDGKRFTVTGKQLRKIFDSTNFNDMGSLRYLYKYIEKSGAIDKMISMGLEDGDIITVFDYEMEYVEE